MAFPKISTCLVCEFARQELGNKTILIGFYGAAPVAITIVNFAIPVQLCLVFCGGPGQGKFRVEVIIKGPDGQEIRPVPFDSDLNPTFTSSNFFIGVQQLFPGPGEYKATLLANGDPVYEAQFRLTPPEGNAPN